MVAWSRHLTFGLFLLDVSTEVADDCSWLSFLPAQAFFFLMLLSLYYVGIVTQPLGVHATPEGNVFIKKSNDSVSSSSSSLSHGLRCCSLTRCAGRWYRHHLGWFLGSLWNLPLRTFYFVPSVVVAGCEAGSCPIPALPRVPVTCIVSTAKAFGEPVGSLLSAWCSLLGLLVAKN